MPADIDAAIDAGWRLRGILQNVLQLTHNLEQVDWYHAGRYLDRNVLTDADRRAGLQAYERIKQAQVAAQRCHEQALNIAASCPDSLACAGYVRTIEHWTRTIGERTGDEGIRTAGRRMGYQPLR